MSESAGLIVCEVQRQWVSALRRAGWQLTNRQGLPEGGLPEGKRRSVGRPLRQVRGLLQCEDALRDAPGSAVWLEIQPHRIVETLQWLARGGSADRQAVRGETPCHPLWIVAGPARLAGFESLFRAAGAMHAVWSPRQLQPVVRMIERHLDRLPQPEQYWTEAIRQRLPWPTLADR